MSPGHTLTDREYRISRIMENAPPLFSPCLCGTDYCNPASKGCREPMKFFHVCGKTHGGSLLDCDKRVGECLLETAAEKARRLQVKLDHRIVTAPDVLKGLRKRHRKDSGWEQFPEFQLWTRRIDFLAVRLYNSGPPLVGYEVKVDRGDWLAELKDPDKKIEAMEFVSEFYFAAPKGLIPKEEVPKGCGLVEISFGPRGGINPVEVIPAQQFPVTEIPVLFVARMLWRKRQGQ